MISFAREVKLYKSSNKHYQQIRLTLSGDIRLTNELCVRRIISHAENSREHSFINGVRARDGKCVFTGVVNLAAMSNRWVGFRAAHIFPLEKERLWREGAFARWITNTTRGRHRAAINSTQNGMLINAGTHEEFDSYLVSVNPDVSDFKCLRGSSCTNLC